MEMDATVAKTLAGLDELLARAEASLSDAATITITSREGSSGHETSVIMPEAKVLVQLYANSKRGLANLRLQWCVDGTFTGRVPYQKHCWLLMCRALPRGPVLTAGAFVGEHQPADADFLQWFVASANEAVRTGLPTGRGDGSCVPLELAHFIGDVAARALAMGTKRSGYDACPQGYCETVMVGHVPYYPLEEGPERATECFAEPPTKRKFVCRPSPVHELASFHPVKDVIACDLVHGLYGSIMPRIMKMAKGTYGVLRRAKALCRYLPVEAPRQIPQAQLANLTRKEYRPIFLVGISLFRVLDPPHYAIFMKLWLGVRLLGTDPKACFSPARSLLQDFVKLSQPVFHPSMPGTDYYSHMLLYMAREAAQHGVQSMASFEEHIARFRNLQYESGVEDVLKDVVARPSNCRSTRQRPN
ncbi:uncharacterized protein LOC125959328 [Anopheles darlingi]|uniref:uncharacterized protein LOC125959328 n=1 Tax=Anopheles darlingi TaxID=43151 RepID=UPI0021002874|nr:uncharacterized protein LOC125959328 [Anopheles darlingi]